MTVRLPPSQAGPVVEPAGAVLVAGRHQDQRRQWRGRPGAGEQVEEPLDLSDGELDQAGSADGSSSGAVGGRVSILARGDANAAAPWGELTLMKSARLLAS